MKILEKLLLFKDMSIRQVVCQTISILILFLMGWDNFTPPAAFFFYCEKLKWTCGLPQFFSEPNLFLLVF